MTQTENQDLVKDLHSFSGIENLSVSMTEENLFRITKNGNESPFLMQLPINNHLKTPEEIEREFHVINSHKAALSGRKESLDNSGTSISQKDGYINVYNLEMILSGFMEENY